MYEQDNTTNTCDCINAIPNSRPENTIIKANKPRKNNINPLVIILYVKPDKILLNWLPTAFLKGDILPLLITYQHQNLKQ